MAASDNLSRVQFMHIDEIGKMQSKNIGNAAPQWDEHGQRTFPHGTTVADWDRLYRANPAATARYRGMDESMAESGFDPGKPLEVGLAAGDRYTSVLYEGHHRYSSARAAGITHLPVEAEESYSPKKHWGV